MTQQRIFILKLLFTNSLLKNSLQFASPYFIKFLCLAETILFSELNDWQLLEKKTWEISICLVRKPYQSLNWDKTRALKGKNAPLLYSGCISAIQKNNEDKNATYGVIQSFSSRAFSSSWSSVGRLENGFCILWEAKHKTHVLVNNSYMPISIWIVIQNT